MQDPSRAPEIRTGHLWAYRGELGDVVYDFTWSRNRDGPLKMLAGYGGYLQVDAAPAYDDVFAQHLGIIEVGCWAHARRYFKEAMPTAAIPCAQALAIIGQLYGIERAASDKHLDAPTRQGLRQKRITVSGCTMMIALKSDGYSRYSNTNSKDRHSTVSRASVTCAVELPAVGAGEDSRPQAALDV